MDVKQVSSVLIVFLIVSLAPAAAYNFSMFLPGSSVNTDDSGDKMFDQSQQISDPQDGSVDQNVPDTQEYVVQYPVVQYVSDEQTSEQTTNQRTESESTVEDNSTQNGTENSTGKVDQQVVIENNSVVTPVNPMTNESFKNTTNSSTNVTTSNLTNATTDNLTNVTGNFTNATMGNLGDTDPADSTDDTTQKIGMWTSFGILMAGSLVTMAGAAIFIYAITHVVGAAATGVAAAAAASLPVVGLGAAVLGFAAIIGGNIALAIFAFT